MMRSPTVSGVLVNLGLASICALGILTFVQHQQISDLSDQIERYPQVAVVDAGELGVLMALSDTDTAAERQSRMADTLRRLSSEGFLLVDQQYVLTAPDHSVVTPQTLIENSGIEIESSSIDASGELRDDIPVPPRPKTQPSGEER